MAISLIIAVMFFILGFPRSYGATIDRYLHAYQARDVPGMLAEMCGEARNRLGSTEWAQIFSSEDRRVGGPVEQFNTLRGEPSLALIEIMTRSGKTLLLHLRIESEADRLVVCPNGTHVLGDR